MRVLALLAWMTTAWLPGGQSSQSPAPLHVSGRVVDARSGAPLGDVLVQLTAADAMADSRAQLTSSDGAFAFDDVAPGAYLLSASSVGYAFASRRIEAVAGLAPVLVPLTEGTGAYRERVDVTAAGAGTGPIAAATLGSAALQDLRGVATDDPMRAVQALPGVVTGDDFQAGFSVRGSAFRHLGLVVDDAPAARLIHAVQAVENDGSIAMINTDVVDHATLAAGPQARTAGEWLGPTLSFRLREGSRDRTGVRAAISGTSASVVIEGPTDRGRRGSWLVSARKSYLDWLIRQLEPDIDSTIGFADGHAKLVFGVTARDRLELVVVGGDAVYREPELTGANAVVRAGSGSTLAALSWRRAADTVTASTQVAFLGSEFRNVGPLAQELARGYTQELRVQGQAGAVVSSAWSVEAGGAFQSQRANEIRRRFSIRAPGVVALTTMRDQSPGRWQASGWAQAVRRTPLASIAAGARVSGGEAFSRAEVQPWLTISRRVGPATIAGGVGRSVQAPDVLVAPAPGAALAVEAAVDLEVGLEHAHGPLDWRLSVFRRDERNLLRPAAEDRIDPLTGARRQASPFPEYVSTLEGAAAGIDVVVTRRRGTITGWVGYTWAHTSMRDVTTGEVFDGDVDQRHTLNAVGAWRLSHQTTMGAKLRLGSNTPIIGYFDERGEVVWLGTERNRLRLPTYARLDLRLTRTFVWPRRRLTLFAEVMNVLARENLGQAAAAVRSNLEVVRVAERLVPFVPSVGFRLEF